MGLETPTRDRFLVVRNPAAGGAGRRLTERCLASLRRQGCELDIVATRAAGDATKIVRDRDLAQINAVIAAGGDGTVREVVEALIGTETPLGLIPAGTANVLACELRLPRNPEQLATFLREVPAVAVTLGCQNNPAGTCHFVLMAGAGFDARVVAGVDVRLKRLVGKGAYIWRSVRELWNSPAGRLRILIDGKEHDTAWVVVSNVSRYAGDYVIAPKARLTDEKFQVCLYDRGDVAGVFAFGLALGRGRLADLAGYRVLEGRRIEILGPTGDPLQIDGDPAGELPVRIESVPQAIRLVMK